MTVAPPTDAAVHARLHEAGVPGTAAHAYGSLVRQAHAVLGAAGVPVRGRRAWIVPGRIEVLGKHVDYAGGRSLLCAVDRGIAVVARRRTDAKVVVRDAVLGEAVVVPLHGAPAPGAPTWTPYVATVVHRLVRNFGEAVQGCDIALAGNLPAAAGLSSSASLIVGLGLALAHTGGIARLRAWRDALPDTAHLAGYLGTMENGTDFGPLVGEAGLGLLNGAQDQAAILGSRAGALGVVAWAPVRFERWVPWPADHVFVIAVSGVRAEKTGDAMARYNRLARTVSSLLAAWNAATGRHDHSLGAALASGTDAPDRLRAVARDATGPALDAAHRVARVEQFIAETTEHVPRAADALGRGDFAAFAEQVARSQRWAEHALGNQVPETIALVERAHGCGAVAASAFGAGFGGSVWAMVPQADATPFMTRWQAEYVALFPGRAPRTHFFVTRPGPPAFELVAHARGR